MRNLGVLRLDFLRALALGCAVTGILVACAALLVGQGDSAAATAPSAIPAEHVPRLLAPARVAQPVRQAGSRWLAAPPLVEVARLSGSSFVEAARDNPALLGSIALGRPNRGFLFNAVQMAADDSRWKLEEPNSSFGTLETVAALELAIAEVHRLFPDTGVLSVGHISRAGGGWLRPHRSHQNGRDVDLGYYYNDRSKWYTRATVHNLDVARTWALLSAMERAGGLEYVFIDRSLHEALRKRAVEVGEPKEFIEHMFDGPMPERGPTIRHARGHATHIHVRFLSSVAVENAQRVSAQLGGRRTNSGVLLKRLRQQQQRADRLRARQAQLSVPPRTKRL